MKLLSLILLVVSLLLHVAIADPQLPKEKPKYEWFRLVPEISIPDRFSKQIMTYDSIQLSREKIIRKMYSKSDADKILKNLTPEQKDIMLNLHGIAVAKEKFGKNLDTITKQYKTNLKYFKIEKDIYFIPDGKYSFNYWGCEDLMECLRYDFQLETDNSLFPKEGNDFDGNPMPVRDEPVAKLCSSTRIDPKEISPSLIRASVASSRWYFEKVETESDFLNAWDIAIKTYQTAPNKDGWCRGFFQNRSIPFKLRQLIRIYMEEMATPEDKQKLQDYIQKCVLDKSVV